MRLRAMGIGTAVLMVLAVQAAPAAAQARVRVSGRASVRVGPVRGDVVVGSTYRRVPYRRIEYGRGRRYADRDARYCNDGYGHPRGWDWCVEAGYLRPYFRMTDWVARYDWRFVFQYRRDARWIEGRHLDERDLHRIMGPRNVQWLRGRAQRLGVHGRLSGGWADLPGGGLALGVFVRGLPIAELRDQDRDGYVDVTFYSVGRW
jgi:hypothetical protein